MAKEMRRIDITKEPALIRLAEEIMSGGEPRLLGRDGEDLVIVTPVRPKAQRRRPRATSAGDRDAILGLIGIGESAEPTDIARHKHEYLAEAYQPKPQ